MKHINQCRKLYCKDPNNDRMCITRGPAVDGTKCGDNKWCIAGNCVSMSSPKLYNPEQCNGKNCLVIFLQISNDERQDNALFIFSFVAVCEVTSFYL